MRVLPPLLSLLALLLLGLVHTSAQMGHTHPSAVPMTVTITPIMQGTMQQPSLPLGLATPIPAADNPLAFQVGINTAAPLTSVVTTPLGSGLGTPVLQLVNHDQNALKNAIAVQMIVQGMDVVDALAVGEIPQAGQGHFHCRLDNQPVVATASPRLDWHEVPSGLHTVGCYIADNAHNQVSDMLTVQAEVM